MPLLDRYRVDSLDDRPLAGGTRHDGIGTAWTNKATGQGGKLDRQVWTDFRSGAPVDEQMAVELMRDNALGRRIIVREIEDALREGFTVTGQVHGTELTPEDQQAIETWGSAHGLSREIFRARMWARARGLGVWGIAVDDGRASSEPIDFAALRSVLWVRTYKPRDVVVERWQDDPARARYGEPELYRLSNRHGSDFVFHWSRVIVWHGEDLGADYERDNELRGGSVLDLVWTSLLAHGVTHQYAIEALQLLTQGVFSSPHLTEAVLAGKTAKAKARFEGMRLSMSMLGDLALGAGETYSVTSRPISGIKDVIDAVVSALVAATDMPEPVLLGKRPGGISTSSDSDIRAWYDHVAATQKGKYTPPLERLFEIASRASDGPTCGCPIQGLGIEWAPLWQMTAAEAATVRKTNADARSVDINSLVVEVDEARTDPTLAEDYELKARALELPDEQEVLAETDVADPTEVADASLIPEGEPLIPGRAAAEMLGFKTTSAVLGFCKKHGVPVFRPGSQFRFARSHLLTGLREAQVPVEL